MTDSFQTAFNRERSAIRNRYGLSHATDASLAALLGVSVSCVTKWRRGERAPAAGVRVGLLEKMANFQPNQ